MRMSEAALNPGRTWRLGLAAGVLGPSPQYKYYPGGEVGRQIAPPAKSKRVKADQDTVKPGELHKSPVDSSAPSLPQPIEEPGVFLLFAGLSAEQN